jgi:bacterioferritin-associated ferredoxin
VTTPKKEKPNPNKNSLVDAAGACGDDVCNSTGTAESDASTGANSSAQTGKKKSTTPDLPIDESFVRGLQAAAGFPPPAKGAEKYVCYCNRVPKEPIENAIRRGCHSLSKIFDATNAGVGPCGGSCRPYIQKMLDGYLSEGKFPERPRPGKGPAKRK